MADIPAKLLSKHSALDARFLWLRLVSKWSAACYCNAMLADRAVQAMLRAEDPFVAHACFVSALNYYYRTFEQKHDATTETGWAIRPKKDIGGIDRGFHDWLINLRNKAIAHHDRDDHGDRVVFPFVEAENADAPDLKIKFYHVPIPMAALTFGFSDPSLANRVRDHVALVFGHVKSLCANTLVELTNELRRRTADEIALILTASGSKAILLHEGHGPLLPDDQGVVTFTIDPTAAEPDPPKSSSKVPGLSVLKVRIDIKGGQIQFMHKIE